MQEMDIVAFRTDYTVWQRLCGSPDHIEAGTEGSVVHYNEDSGIVSVEILYGDEDPLWVDIHHSMLDNLSDA